MKEISTFTQVEADVASFLKGTGAKKSSPGWF